MDNQTQTPGSNTGVKLTELVEVGVDWLSGTFDQSLAGEVMPFLESVFADQFVLQKRGIGFYSQSYRSLNGLVLGLYPVQTLERVRTDAYLSIPASSLIRLTVENQQSLFARLHEVGFLSSRIDLRADDYGKTVTVEKVEEAVEAGNVAGFRAFRAIHSGRIGFGRVGRTVEFGRRGKSGCGKFVRIYDKSFQSAGEIDATRIELELSGGRSRECFSVLAQTPVEFWGELIAGWLKDAIAFVDRQASERLDRCPYLDWWQALVEKFDRLSLSVPRVKSNLEAMKSWIKQQVAPSFATVLAAFIQSSPDGYNDWSAWLWEILDNGERRLRERHIAILETS